MFKTYETRDALMRALAVEVASDLRRSIDDKGDAFFSVPGGSTPIPFFHALSTEKLDWEAVTIVLNDERLVDENSERSNTAMIKANLMQNAASEASFFDLRDDDAPLDLMLPIDVLVLGMGPDMHTASIFPCDPNIMEALSDDAPDIFEAKPASQPEIRRSFSARVLRLARFKHVLITGEEKRRAYEKAREIADPSHAPIFIMMDEDPASFHYAD